MKIDRVAITLIAGQSGEFTIDAAIGDSCVGIHWRSWRDAREMPPYYNGPIRLDHVEQDVTKVLRDGRVWVDDDKHDEYHPDLVAAARFIYENTRRVIPT